MEKKPTYIIGTHSGHDASACLMADNKILCAITKERITRKKHDSGEPIDCIDYILETTSLQKKDIDLVVRTNWFDSKELNDNYYNDFPKVINSQKHHDFHAWSTLTVMPSTPCLIVVIDGRGCRPQDLTNPQDGLLEIESHLQQFEVESVYLFDGREMQVVEKRWGTYYKNKYRWGSHIDSLGYAYAAVSKTIFGSSHAAGKVMALAAFGKKNDLIPEPFIFDETIFKVNDRWLQFVNNIDVPISWGQQLSKDLAFSIQNALESYLLFRIPQLIRKYNVNAVCLSGGVALNCKANGLLAQLPEMSKMAIFNACGDDGLSIGAAIWANNTKMHNEGKVVWSSAMGKSYLTNHLVEKELFDEVALHLTQNKLIGLFTGGSEFGPRALGYRSILASPLDSSITSILNLDIKQREGFRPFGFAVLKSDLNIVTDEKLASVNMLSAIHLKQEWKNRYPALLHVDETSRIQVIEDGESHFGEILKRFKEITGCPFLINTSFNGKEEPIVETPEQALKTGKEIKLDFVLLENKLIALKEYI